MAGLLNILLAAAFAAFPPAFASSASAQPTDIGALAAEARDAAAIVDSFHAALRSGDTGAALALLADDVLIYEGGRVERSKAEYAAHHLAADAAFSKAVSSTLTRRAGGAGGDTAWIASEGLTTGEYKGRPINRVTAETIVLRRSGGAWKIVHVHWSGSQ